MSILLLRRVVCGCDSMQSMNKSLLKTGLRKRNLDGRSTRKPKKLQQPLKFVLSCCISIFIAVNWLVYEMVKTALCLQCFDAVGWVAGRASGL